jgi:hypothetical protein
MFTGLTALPDGGGQIGAAEWLVRYAARINGAAPTDAGNATCEAVVTFTTPY